MCITTVQAHKVWLPLAGASNDCAVSVSESGRVSECECVSGSVSESESECE